MRLQLCLQPRIGNCKQYILARFEVAIDYAAYAALAKVSGNSLKPIANSPPRFIVTDKDNRAGNLGTSNRWLFLPRNLQQTCKHGNEGAQSLALCHEASTCISVPDGMSDDPEKE